MKLIFLMIITFLSINAAAGLNEKISLETLVETRVRKLVKPFDTHAQVLVKVLLKEQSAPLAGTPGLSLLNISSSKNIQSLDFNDVKSIDIRVLTSNNKVPSYLQKEIKTLFKIKGTRLKVNFAEMDEQSRLIIENQSMRNILQNEWSQIKEIVYMMLAGPLFLFVLLFWFFTSRSKSHVSDQVEKIVSALNAASSASSAGMNPQLLEQGNESNTNKPKQELLGAQVENLHYIDLPQTVSLFSDCYWAQMDNYAAWLWSKFSPEQRLQLIHSWPKADKYSKYLTYIEPTAEFYHNHPSYLEPLACENISQEDLATWLRSNPSAWSYMTPIRQENCPISIQEHIHFLNAAITKREKVELPTFSSEERSLVLKANFNDITDEDELAIWENPSFVPEELRQEIPTLIWLAQIDLDQQQEIFSELTAMQIAQAWIGPVEVLEKLKLAIPEKKWTLIDSYMQKVSPSRQTRAFQFLVTMSMSPPEIKDVTPSEEALDESA